MSDKDVENLVRMAVEIDEVERLASAGAHGVPVRVAADDSSRTADGRPLTIRCDHLQSRRSLWRISLSAAAAAACMMLLIQPRPGQLAPPDIAAVPVEIDYCPGIALPDGLRIDHFEPTAPEYCVVLALFHTWHDECQCLAWQLHEWEDGRTLAEIGPGQSLEIPLDVTDAPPLQQLLLVAVSQDAALLPRTAEETYDLMDCLNEVTPPTDPCDSAAAYASAVKACLSERVEVMPRPFFVE